MNQRDALQLFLFQLTSLTLPSSSMGLSCSFIHEAERLGRWEPISGTMTFAGVDRERCTRSVIGIGKEKRACRSARLIAPCGRPEKQKVCLHPLAAPHICDKIVLAHTLQKSRSLERILDSSNHVCTFYPHTPDSNGQMMVQKWAGRKLQHLQVSAPLMTVRPSRHWRT